MFSIGGKKNLNMYILKILEEYTDADNVLTQDGIIEKLRLFGMECERHTVKSNLDALRTMGYKIISTTKGSYLEKDSLNVAELRMLIDNVLFSKNISQDDKKSLLEKLRGMANTHSKDKLPRTSALMNMIHSENTQTLDALSIIGDAIEAGKKIQFVYNRYGIDFKLHPRREEPYIVNPYQLVVSNGRYYLLGNYDKYDDISHYRVDRITCAKILPDPVKSKKQIKDFIQGVLNLPQHMAEHIYMYNGESVWIKFWADAEIMDDLVDWFGKKFTVLKSDETKILVRLKCNEQAMIDWALQYGKHVVIVEPQKLRQSLENILRRMVAAYEA